MKSAYFCNISMSEYLGDLGRQSGSSLRMAVSEPELYQRWAAGEDVDRPTAAKGQGSYLHHVVQYGDEGVSEDFAFYPNRLETMVDEKKVKEGINPKTGNPYKTPSNTGRKVPQDPTQAGAFKAMNTQSKDAKRMEREFFESARGRTVLYPESFPVVNAMRRAVAEHKDAAALVARDGVFAPEVTAHFTCPHTGEPLRVRYDGLRVHDDPAISEDIAIEIKTIASKGEDRLDADNASMVKRWALDGWAYKSAMYHDAFLAVTGRACVLHWILVEARTDDPRVVVVEDHHDSVMATAGRVGCADYGFKGYREAAKIAKAMRESGDFRHRTVRRPLSGFEFPGHFVTSMQFEHEARGNDGSRSDVPDIPVMGGTPLAEYDGR